MTRRRGRGRSRHSCPVFPLLRHGPARSSPTAGNADRAVLYDFRRFSARIRTLGDPPKRQADEVADGFIDLERCGRTEAEPEPLTLEKLFDIYGEEVTPTKGERSQLYDRAATRMFLECFGRDRKPATLSQRDWDRFIGARRSGRVGPSGEPVSDRTVERDLRFLLAVLNWAARSRDEEGRLLLESNPLRGFKPPREKNSTRIVLSEAEYRALLKVSRRVDWRFRVALVLAHETGQRTAGGLNHGRKSRKFNQDCTICVSRRRKYRVSSSHRSGESRIEWRESEALSASVKSLPFLRGDSRRTGTSHAENRHSERRLTRDDLSLHLAGRGSL